MGTYNLMIQVYIPKLAVVFIFGIKTIYLLMRKKSYDRFLAIFCSNFSEFFTNSQNQTGSHRDANFRPSYSFFPCSGDSFKPLWCFSTQPDHGLVIWFVLAVSVFLLTKNGAKISDYR